MDIRFVASAAEGIGIAADTVAQAAHAAWTAQRNAHVVISGGRSGAALGAAICDMLADSSAGILHVWIADERYVGYDDVDRNDTAIVTAMQTSDSKCVVHRHLTPQQADVTDAAEAYAGELESYLGDAPFDAVVLSAGEDGHVASIFPGHVQHYENAYAESQSPKPPAIRTTISLARLANTRSCAVLALGESKAQAVRGFIAGDMALPARQLAAITRTVLITDVRSGIDSATTAVDPA
jgi:6-phosphogluconolactonase